MSTDWAARIDRGAAAQRGWLRDLRRDLHRRPELRYLEVETAGRLAEEMRALGLETRTGLAQTGLTARISGGAAPGTAGVRCVALRADMDALPVEEETGLPFASEVPGLMHACGHDAHSAVVATAARVVALDPELRAALPGELVFLFQPAEEGGLGAAEMMKAGALEDPDVDAILGMHVYPGLRTGEVSVYESFSHASADSFDLAIYGRGGHAGYPHQGVDPVSALGDLLVGIRSLVSREVDPLVPAVLSIGAISGGHTHNVLPDAIRLKGTLRCLDEPVRAYLKRRLLEMAEGLAAAHRCRAELRWVVGCPATANDPRISRVFAAEAAEFLAPGGVKRLPPGMGAEDFGIYTEALPGALFRLGCTAPDAAEWFPLHSPRFTIDEDALELAVRVLLRSAFRLLTAGLEGGEGPTAVPSPGPVLAAGPA